MACSKLSSVDVKSDKHASSAGKIDFNRCFLSHKYHLKCICTSVM